MQSALSSIKNDFFGKKASKIGLAIIITLAALILGGIFFGHFSPYYTSTSINQPPSSIHIFGTDYLGHDLFAQVAWGAIPSLLVAITAALGSVLIGMFVGIAGGYFNRTQGPLNGVSDAIMVFPIIPLLLLIGSLLPPSNLFIAGILTLVLWPTVARAMRVQVSSLKKRAFVDAAKLSGYGDGEIVLKIMVPETGSIAIAYFIINVSVAILVTTALEFLGVGNPDVVSWGSILYWAQQFGFLAGAWWWVVVPGAFITLFALGFALIGFSLEEVFNPRLKR
ncbi:MAG: ABC transporter permease [Nitrososphaerales archaeon]